MLARKMKKAFAILLALTLALGALPVLAAPPEEPTPPDVGEPTGVPFQVEHYFRQDGNNHSYELKTTNGNNLTLGGTVNYRDPEVTTLNEDLVLGEASQYILNQADTVGCLNGYPNITFLYKRADAEYDEDRETWVLKLYYNSVRFYISVNGNPVHSNPNFTGQIPGTLTGITLDAEDYSDGNAHRQYQGNAYTIGADVNDYVNSLNETRLIAALANKGVTYDSDTMSIYWYTIHEGYHVHVDGVLYQPEYTVEHYFETGEDTGEYLIDDSATTTETITLNEEKLAEDHVITNRLNYLYNPDVEGSITKVVSKGTEPLVLKLYYDFEEGAGIVDPISYPYKVVYYNDYTNTVLGSVSNPDMVADEGTTLTETDVTNALVDHTNWINAMQPAGYTAGTVTYPTIAASPEGQWLEDVWDDTAITNIVEVHYNYVAPPSGGPERNYYTVTVNYLEEGTENVLATRYTSGSIMEGNPYDVTQQAGRAIEGYAISSVEGAVTGQIGSNVTINVWYTADVPVEDPEIPMGDIPDLVPETPITEEPIAAPDAEVIVVDETTPLGDLPQTGTTGQPVDATRTLGMLALASALAAAAMALGRRKDEEEA